MQGITTELYEHLIWCSAVRNNVYQFSLYQGTLDLRDDPTLDSSSLVRVSARLCPRDPGDRSDTCCVMALLLFSLVPHANDPPPPARRRCSRGRRRKMCHAISCFGCFPRQTKAARARQGRGRDCDTSAGGRVSLAACVA